MTQHWLQKIIILSLISFSCLNVQARKSKLQVDEKMLTSVNELLARTSELHKALYKQRSDQIKKEILEMNMKIDSLLKNMGDFQVQNQAMHLKRILQSTRTSLESYENLRGTEKRTKSLKKAFSQLIQLVRMFPVDKKYRIFYCKSDNSEWIQEGWRAANPINPDRHGKCGQRAYR